MMRTATAVLVLSLACFGSMGGRSVRAQTAVSPFVIVQAVDELWLPVPGAVVHLRQRLGTRTAHKATTNADGFASFRFTPPDARQAYDLSVTMEGFENGELKDVRFGSCTGDCPSSRYIQVRLVVAGPRFTIK
jgi:hypothetical protein